MTKGFRRWSFASGDGFVRTLPSLSTVELNAEVYATNEKFLPFKVFGIFEEFEHSHQKKIGHTRNIRLLEQDSAAALTALINRQEDLVEAKKKIVQNELACEHIYDGCNPLVEAMDKYTTFFKIKKAESEAIAENISIDRIGTMVGEREMAKLEPEVRNLYEKFTMLGREFDGWVIPWLAGFIALNIPMFHSQIPPIQRTEQILAIDFSERFKLTFEILINKSDQIPNLTFEDLKGEKLDLFFDKLMSELRFEPIFSQTARRELPLLDIPYRHAPSFDIIEQKNQQIENKFRGELSGLNLQLQRIMADIARFFDSSGCVILHNEDLDFDVYIPNWYVLNEKIGEYYLPVIFKSITAASVIDQIIHRSITNSTGELTCPFCGARHDPWKAQCRWDPDLWNSKRGLTDAGQWEDYPEKTMAVLDDFVATEVPGEDQLADYRARRHASV